MQVSPNKNNVFQDRFGGALFLRKKNVQETWVDFWKGKHPSCSGVHFFSRCMLKYVHMGPMSEPNQKAKSTKAGIVASIFEGFWLNLGSKLERKIGAKAIPEMFKIRIQLGIDFL